MRVWQKEEVRRFMNKPETTSNFTDEEKDKLINKEIKRLKETCINMDEERLTTADGLIKEAAFMSITLLDLKKSINKSGCVSIYQNGENQWGTKKSPEIDVYNTMIKNYMQIIKQLAELLPSESPEASREIMEFLRAR